MCDSRCGLRAGSESPWRIPQTAGDKHSIFDRRFINVFGELARKRRARWSGCARGRWLPICTLRTTTYAMVFVHNLRTRLRSEDACFDSTGALDGFQRVTFLVAPLTSLVRTYMLLPVWRTQNRVAEY